MYLKDDELVYEIILSQGKGILTPRAYELLMKISNEFIRSFHFYDEQDLEDAKATGLFVMITKYQNYNRKKYTKALPYFSELFKRGVTQSWREFEGRRIKTKQLSLDWFLEERKGGF